MRALAALLVAAALWAAAPARIVSTAPSITETLYALGLGPRVVAVTTYCRYPPEVVRKPKIGSFLNPNLEVILGLRPDLVIIHRNPTGLARRLQDMGLKTLEVDQQTMADVFTSMHAIGAAAGVPEAARAVERAIRAQLEQVRSKTAKLPHPRTMFLAGRTPGAIEGMVAAGGGSYHHELIEIAGGKNIFESATGAYPKVSLEEVLSRDPEVIIDMGEMSDPAGVTEERKRAVVALWHKYPVLSAVRNGRVYAVASDIFVVPGPRMVEAVRAFAAMIHPEAGF
ncbi:MAG: cobalamin-binding protein [Bryobacteraceae bacterium]|nr:cobalamin-binding protein [Bryobacterales bacterium]NUN01739.1 cobalamin-binding protein [Bryobacteraceae bacterium]